MIMNEFFVNLLFGHIIGDYFLQNRLMSTTKNKDDFKGYVACTIHCLIYTLSICIFTGAWNPLFILLVFGSHFVIDKFSLADVWLKLIRGRSIKYYLEDDNIDITEKHLIMRGSFTGIVYVVVDNTMHLLIMYYVGRTLL